MAPSSEEPEAAAGASDTASVVSNEVRPVAGAPDAASVSSEPVSGGPEAGSVISDEVRALAAGADTGLVPFEPAGGGPEVDSVVSGAVRAVACRTAGADRGCVSVVFSVSSAPGDDVFRASGDFLCSPLRNRRHVSEFCSASAALGPTAGLAPSASLVSTSSCPLMGNPLRIW